MSFLNDFYDIFFNITNKINFYVSIVKFLND